MKEIIINKNDSGQRLDRFLSKAIPLLPASLRQKYLRLKRFKVNGRAARGDYRLELGDKLSMYINSDFFVTDSSMAITVGKPCNKHMPEKTPLASLDILYEDDNILLVNKASGVLSHSDSASNQNNLLSSVRFHLLQSGQWDPHAELSFTPALCNRLDRNTSGIVIAAKNAAALRIINEKLRLREIDKYYLAVVHGVPSPKSGILDTFHSKDTEQNIAEILKTPNPNSASTYKSSVTEYSTIATTNELSLVECKLITGRSHQLRAQLAAIGNPILGDIKYGGIEKKRRYKEQYQVLCSYKLVFTFKTCAGSLNYLRGKTFAIESIPFVDKYFPFKEFSV